MTAIEISEEVIDRVKTVLKPLAPLAKPSHIAESLARGLGYRTNAALRADFSDPPNYQLFYGDDFLARLAELRGAPCSVHSSSLHQRLLEQKAGGIIRTWVNDSYLPKREKSLRFRVWRRVMVAAINETIRRGLLSVRPGDNRWPDAAGVSHFFEIEGAPAYVHVRDAGFDELRFRVIVWPNEKITQNSHPAGPGMNRALLYGDLYASGWLERRDGAWLQLSRDVEFHCRRKRLICSKDFTLERPLGFSSVGPFKL